MQWIQRLKAIWLPAGRSSSARVLSEQILLSLRLQPVSLVGQLMGATALLVRFWDNLSEPLLVVWAIAVLATVIAWTHLRRKFASDPKREDNIRAWLKRWMMMAVATGIVWGFAGVAFLITQETIDVVVLVSVMVAVVFASWPAFSCWIPGLTVVMFLSLVPMTIALSSAFEVGRTAVMAVVIVLLCFVLYCGRRLSEIVLMAVTRDVQNERLVARLKSAKSKAESERRATAAASERRAKFFAGANHDLRQPLQAMGIYLQILQMQAKDSEREVIGQLSATANNISTLVEQLLEVSRLEAADIEVKPEAVSIEALFAELAREFAPVAADKGFLFLTRPLPLTLHTDPLMLTRILRNLITNAIRYSSRPGSKIMLAARRLGSGRITLGVYDEGPGIARDERRRIFEAFYRGQAGKASEGGYGLGLSIVSGLARHLGVPVTVGSRPGRGSVFRIEFDAVHSEKASQQADGLPLITDLDMRGVVGILEDNDIVRNALSAIVKSWGATVVAQRQPTEEFINRLVVEAEDKNLAAFISDYNLGEGVMTGLEAIFAVRLGASRNFPCVLLTAVSEDEIRRAYRALCMNPDNQGQTMPVILQKPAGAEALASALRRAVAENRRVDD